MKKKNHGYSVTAIRIKIKSIERRYRSYRENEISINKEEFSNRNNHKRKGGGEQTSQKSMNTLSMTKKKKKKLNERLGQINIKIAFKSKYLNNKR